MRSKTYHWPSRRRHWRIIHIYKPLKSKAFHIIKNKIWVYGPYTQAKHNIKPKVESHLIRMNRTIRTCIYQFRKQVNKSIVLKGLQE
jgi:hypothetical protein